MITIRIHHILMKFIALFFLHRIIKRRPKNDLVRRIRSKRKFNSRVLYDIIKTELKKEKWIWYIFVCACVLPLSSYFLKDDKIDNIVLIIKDILTNLSYSYVAGVVFYFFSSFLPRVKKIHKSKICLCDVFGQIHSCMYYLAYYFSCIDSNGVLYNDAENRMRNAIVVNDTREKCLFSSIRAFFFKKYCGGIDSEKKSMLHHVYIKLEAVERINAVFSILKNEIAGVQNLYFEILTEEEIKKLHEIKNIHQILFYSSPLNIASSRYCVCSANDLDYFISSFVFYYNVSKRLKGDYARYSFYRKAKS